ncbi:monothiol glutaredoxin-S1-like [Cynara cardunculus var. scolymus]|uniref:Glutaredoxin n=1 Tax=Cynara cardunculus var. scolymus TaxID=59895 RepID=A0A118K096_CYNCS|nr:monothiol glutaredoxin-S1-like [Cynara cardunculus var. scolymus]KVI00933.1 Glutaredoxin [Cynara cardunculus var. scolymus]
MGKVKRLVANNPVVIFSKTSCCISHTVKSLISNFGASPTVYELDELSNGKQIEEELVGLGCPTIPAVFIGKKMIGGANEVMSLNVKSKLKPLLIQAKAIWV